MSELPILDPQAVENLRSISPDDGTFLHGLVSIFLADTPKHITAMQLALTRNGAAELGRLAHQVKGSASNFGATRLIALCLELEQLGKASDLAAARTKLDALRAEFDQVRRALESLAGIS
ncbi:MAG TPA: Hpt domain-containing protein [Candidatus Didemnitutus sp.]|nr:Hpt domain-containing protein [Candidatus Didemnitutus sp.]